ncbi:MAG: hypothetical protein UY87_C0070G0011, partial [Candidatus Peribacteria bacterium GW2011_GWC2_54_8]
WLESKPGQGSRFFFALPVCKQTGGEAIEGQVTAHTDTKAA